MPKYASQVKSAESPETVKSLIAGYLAAQGYKPTQNGKDNEWRKGVYWFKYAHYSYAGGVVTIEVWNHFPHSGIGSLVMYFAGIGEIKALLRDLEHVLTNGSTNVQKDCYGSTAMGSAAPTVVQALKVKAKARNATFAEQVCPRCRTSTHIEEEGDRKFETCDECGWSRVAATREVAELAEPIISEDASPEDPLASYCTGERSRKQGDSDRERGS